MIRGRRQFKGLLRERNWDLVQVQSPVAAALSRTVGRIHQLPSIYVAHGFHFHTDGRPSTNVAFAAVESLLAWRTSAVAVVSAEDFRMALRLGMHRHSLLWRLPGAGVDLSRFRRGDSPPAQAPVALFCGELNENKDPLLVLRVVHEVRRCGVDLRVVLVGDGPLRDKVANWGHLEWVTTHRSVRPDELASLMASASLLIAPSHREGLPRVLIEAIAAGLPVVARANRGSRSS